MTAGARNRKVMFQRYETVEDPFGGETKEWADYEPEWANVVYGSGSERREAAQEAGSLTATFYVLRNAKTQALTVKDRVSYDGATWDITSAVPSRTYNEEIEVTATRAT